VWEDWRDSRREGSLSFAAVPYLVGVMIEVEFDGDILLKQALDLGASIDQIPYILARSMNDAAQATRSYLIGTTWPSHVQVRNTSFLNAALTTKDARASKDHLEVTIYDKLGRANLELHAEGGTRTPHGSNLAIGSSNVQRGARGVVPSQRPRALKNAIRIGDVVYQRINGRLKLMYVIKPQAQIKKDVPFKEDFARVMTESLQAAIPRNVARAMQTRRR
jgi:hypothetical protein